MSRARYLVIACPWDRCQPQHIPPELVAQRSAQFQAISVRATQESFIEQALADLEKRWGNMDFVVTVVEKDRREVLMLGAMDAIAAALEDSLVTVDVALSSRYAQVHLEAASDWQRRLRMLREMLDDLEVVQKQWLYLGQASDVSRGVCVCVAQVGLSAMLADFHATILRLTRRLGVRSAC